MTDLTNPFPQHGSTGEVPPSGLDKSAGDQYEAEYFDFYSDSYYKQTEEVNAAITRRVEHLHKDVIIDGLSITNATASRDVAVQASNGAYVNGQFTGAIDSKLITLSSNGSGSTRTDTIYVDANGNVQQKTGSTTAPSGTYKLAEADINTSDVVVDVRDYGRLIGYSGAAVDPPLGRAGDTLLHEGGRTSTDDDSFEVHDQDSWHPLMFADGRQKWTDTHDANGNDLINVGNISDTNGNAFSDTFVDASGDTMSGRLDMQHNSLIRVPEPSGPYHAANQQWTQNNFVDVRGDNMSGELDMNSNNIVDVRDPINEQDVANRGWVENNFAPDNHGHDNAYVNASGDDMTGTLDMQNNSLLGLNELHGGNGAAIDLNYSTGAGNIGVNVDVDMNQHQMNNADQLGLGDDSAVRRDGDRLMWSPPNTNESFEVHPGS